MIISVNDIDLELNLISQAEINEKVYYLYSPMKNPNLKESKLYIGVEEDGYLSPLEEGEFETVKDYFEKEIEKRIYIQ